MKLLLNALIIICIFSFAILFLMYIQKINFVVISKFLYNPLVYSTSQIKGNTMVPNFTDGQFYISKKLLENETLSRREVVVTGSPFDYQLHIKRIIGLPGDTILLKGGRIFVNDSLIEEPYLPSSSQLTSSGKYLPENESIKVPTGWYFLLNDNRNNDDDSRKWGFVQRVHIHDQILECYKNCSNIVKIPDIDRPLN